MGMPFGRFGAALVLLVALSCLLQMWVLFSLGGATRMVTNEDAAAVPSRPSDVGALGTTNSINGASLLERQKRMDRYRAVYKYVPPAVPSVSSEDTKCSTAPDFESYFALPVQERSRNNEDQAMYSLFREHHPDLGGSKGMTFIELGAFNGVQESNSRFFQECLNWTGLLIEANPFKYEELVKNRPNTHRMSFAPSCSIRKEANNATIKFVAQMGTMAGLSLHVRTSGRNVVKVPCGSLGPVIQDIFRGGHVHFFSLDVEGAEPLVLKNIDFSKVFIEAIMVESWSRNCPQEPKECRTRSDAREVMKKAGYHLFNTVVEKSDLYLHPNSPLMNISATPVW
jgi:Methyltransferase FkbM domain